MTGSLAPSTFLLRNAPKTLPLIGVIVLAVMLIAGIVSIMNSIPLSIRTTYGYSKAYLGMTPRGDNEATPKIRRVIETESPVQLERLVVCRVTDMQVKSIVGPWRFALLGLPQDQMLWYIDRIGKGRLEGRLPAPGAAEALVSEPVARNLGKKLGDTLLSPDDSDSFSPRPVRIVGLVHMEPWLAFSSYEYLQANHFPPVDVLIAAAKTPTDQEKLDRWANDRFKGEQARVFAYFLLEKETDEMFKILYSILNVVIGLLVVVITVMMAMLMNIYQSQRLQEFGLLQALGYTKGALLGRALSESALVVLAGWLLGVVCAFGLLTVVRAVLMEPRAFMLDPWDKTAYLYTVPVPISIFLAAALTVMARFRRFDPVGVVERRLV
ncbi:MAG: ABC transporter permease [Fimbriimonadaceae bacterium]|nr:ABC transporter permease [Fimbriimonadaceae bacterium]QYK58312.1 MAG: ABC transporter permease [Fimbriimonadaceae bacterium]